MEREERKTPVYREGKPGNFRLVPETGLT